MGGNPISFVDPSGLAGGPPAAGTYYPRGSMPSGPPRMTPNAQYEFLFRQGSNVPGYAQTLPAGQVGMNSGFDMNGVMSVCEMCVPGGQSIRDLIAQNDGTNSDGLQCRASKPDPNGPSMSAPGQGPACTCVKWRVLIGP